ncbi:YceI family protein [Flaviaesturariibacter terrae]
MKKLVFAALLALSSSALFAQTSWNLDPTHSNVRFTVSHLVISEVEGTFKKFNGTVQSAKPDFADAAVNFAVDINSINTDNDGRDQHLKSDDFFNAAKYPQMTFRSTSFRKISGNQYELRGNLTIRDVTKPVTFRVTYGGTVKDPWGNIKAGFKATGSINRFDYGLRWNNLTEAGGAVVGKDIAIDLRLEFAQAK